MDRGNVGRWLLIGLAVFLFMNFGPRLFGGDHSARQPLKAESDRAVAASERPKEEVCDVWGPSFHAQLSNRGASLKHFELLPAKYQRDGKPIDVVTTPDVENRRQLRFQFRNPAANIPDDAAQLKLDAIDFRIEKADGKACTFVHRDERSELRQVVRATERPYELISEATLTNLSDKPLRHALTVHTDAWRKQEEVHHTFGTSALLTHVECLPAEGSATRLMPPDFEPDAFQKPEHFPKNALTLGDWYQAPGVADVAAVSNAYFSHALVPIEGPKPTCQLQIEDRWRQDRFPNKAEDPDAGAMYRARLAYDQRTLAPGEVVRYGVLSYVGPKERSVLAEAAGSHHRLNELIDLGFFSSIAKILVAFLLEVHSVIPNWGIAIMLLTITARTLMFPLALPGIKGMIKMRELKPEVDALNEKFKDDAQAKGLAQMELWRKHNVNPIKGCLPQLASMPVWFALYTTLQTAVELYNIRFLWFPDLSAPDPLYVLPFIIGSTSFLQQRLMPLQGDPMQQKMMLYFMPAMFTVFMLFLPAGLGVYMFTNGVLGILQQQAVEWHVRRSAKPGGGPGSGDIKVKVIEDSRASSGAKKGKSGSDPGSKAASANSGKRDERLLGEGKA